jgi:hypothetical protein
VVVREERREKSSAREKRGKAAQLAPLAHHDKQSKHSNFYRRNFFDFD